jgi:hypothetical protein
LHVGDQKTWRRRVNTCTADRNEAALCIGGWGCTCTPKNCKNNKFD